MSKSADRIHLIENKVPMHKSKLKNQAVDSKREKKEVRRDQIKASAREEISAAASPAGPVTTTLVISSTSGVHVAPASHQNHAVDKRTGRYLALGVTLAMIFITLYHTYLRQVPVLGGLVPPAIIMVLYLLWIVYFAKKRKRQVQIELV